MDQENSFQWGIFIFGRGKTNFFGGGGEQLQKWLASDHPGAYTSMPHPFFGAKDVCYCYIEKKVAKKLFLARRAKKLNRKVMF